MKRKTPRLSLVLCYHCGCMVRSLNSTNTCGCVALMPVAFKHDKFFPASRAREKSKGSIAKMDYHYHGTTTN